MEHSGPSQRTPGSSPPAAPDADRAEEYADTVTDLLLDVVARGAGIDEWVATRGGRRRPARLATLGVAGLVGLVAIEVPTALVVVAAALVAVPVLWWASLASDACLRRGQRRAEVARTAEALRVHLGGRATVVLLRDALAPGVTAAADLRATAIRAIDEAGCFGGHSALCRHAGPAVVAR